MKDEEMKSITAGLFAVVAAFGLGVPAGADDYVVPGTHEAIVYTGTSYQGKSMVIPQGRAVKLSGRMNNAIASVVVPHGCILTLHNKHEGLKAFVRLEGAIPSLRRVKDNQGNAFVNRASRAHLRCYD